jgi:cell division protein FtsW (lipid II flippase)
MNVLTDGILAKLGSEPGWFKFLTLLLLLLLAVVLELVVAAVVRKPRSN